MNRKVYYLLLASLLFAQCQPSDGIRLKKGMTISKSVTVSEQIFNINGADSIDEAVLVIEGNDITIDFNGATLQGSNDKSTPDEFYGLGILVQNGKNITIKNLNVKGYKMGLKAVGIDSLKLENCNFSYNYRPNLKEIESISRYEFYLNSHQNDIRTRFGAGIYLNQCSHATVKNIIITEGKNGLMLVNCDNGLFYNNTIQFNSGTGISLLQSNNNRVMHNKLDWNVRQYPVFKKEIENDASGVLINTNSSNNIIAYNSTTHCTNGISISADSQSYGKKGEGSNDNIIYGNDCSYAVRSGIKMIYSSNKVFSNIINSSSTGLNLSFSNHSMIMGNAIEDNQTGIYLSNVQDFQIRHNELFGNATALMTDLTKHPNYRPNNIFSKLNDNISIDHNLIKNSSVAFDINYSKLVKVVLNQFINCKTISIDNNNESLILKYNEENPETVKEINSASFLAYAPQALTDGINTKLTNPEQGKEYILMNEYGTYSFRYPKIWFRSKIEGTGEYLFAFFGPYGNFKLREGINVKEVNLKTGTIPSTIILKKKDLYKPVSLQIEFIGEAIETQFGEKYKKGETFLVEWKD